MYTIIKITHIQGQFPTVQITLYFDVDNVPLAKSLKIGSKNSVLYVFLNSYIHKGEDL